MVRAPGAGFAAGRGQLRDFPKRSTVSAKSGSRTGERRVTRYEFLELLGEAGVPYDPAGPVPLRRVVGGEEDRGDGGGLHDGRGAA
jgi:hypothetical protein